MTLLYLSPYEQDTAPIAHLFESIRYSRTDRGLPHGGRGTMIEPAPADPMVHVVVREWVDGWKM